MYNIVALGTIAKPVDIHTKNIAQHPSNTHTLRYIGCWMNNDDHDP